MALAIRQGASTVLPRSTDVADDFVWGRDRFIEEGRTLASLHDAPAIVRVFDFLEENGTAYIVMELLRGETLDSKLRRQGPQSFAEIDAILWPLLDGLQHVHAAGFLHRDIKPANILLSAAGRPTLIDFGASRAAMAGRTAAMTPVFTPGYAAAEQFTSAKQGPWTETYGLSATLYCAITGQPPPSAFDRMLDDAYEPLGERRPRGFPRPLLAGIDAGLAVRAADRPQSIAAWRPILERGLAPDDVATVLRQRADEQAAQKAEAEAKQIAGAGAKTKAETEARAKADAEAKEKAEAEAKKAAEVAEAGLRLGLADRQRIQVALTSQGFDTRGNDGAFGPRSREMIAGWQKARSLPPTGFLNASQHQALLREATAALGKYDDEQKKLEDQRKVEEDKKKADEAKRKADEEAKARASPSATPNPSPPPATSGSGFDGTYGGGLSQNAQGGMGRVYTVTLTVAGGRATGQAVHRTCGAFPMSLTVSPTGQISGPFRIAEPGQQVCSAIDASISGRISGNRLEFEVRGAGVSGLGSLTKQGG
jgi:serine/threonine protein kinase